MSFFYLATPYSKYPDGLAAAFRMASRNAALFVKAGIPVYSPIAHTHPVAEHGKMDPLDHELWLEADRPFMDAACGLVVVRAKSWEESRGVAKEIRVFTDAGKPIIYMEDGVLPVLPAPVSMVSAGDICRKAASLVGGDRQATHGDKLANHRNIAALWTAFLSDRLREALTALDVTLMMALLKIARTKTGHHNRDDYVDLAGYAGCAGEIAERQAKE